MVTYLVWPLWWWLTWCDHSDGDLPGVAVLPVAGVVRCLETRGQRGVEGQVNVVTLAFLQWPAQLQRQGLPPFVHLPQLTGNNQNDDNDCYVDDDGDDDNNNENDDNNNTNNNVDDVSSVAKNDSNNNNNSTTTTTTTPPPPPPTTTTTTAATTTTTTTTI